MTHTAPITVEPSALPITVADMSAHARIDGDEEARLLGRYIEAATSRVQLFLERQLMPATRRLRLDAFPPGCHEAYVGTPGTSIVLPFAPLRSVTSIEYEDVAGDSQTLSASVYEAKTDREPALVALAPGQSWPSTREGLDRVTITYACGYADASKVPSDIVQALTLIVSTWFRDRELDRGRAMSELPLMANARGILEAWRVRR